MSAAPRPYVGGHNPPARLLWALDGPPDSPIPLTRDMRRGKPVCHHHYQYRADNTRDDSERVNVLDDIGDFAEAVDRHLRHRFGIVRPDGFGNVEFLARMSPWNDPGVDQLGTVFDALRGAERRLYEWLTDQGAGGAPARVRRRQAIRQVE